MMRDLAESNTRRNGIETDEGAVYSKANSIEWTTDKLLINLFIKIFEAVTSN